MNKHIIFEGPELAGKSWLMSQVYEHLEAKHNRSGFVLDGCHWFNCDNGVFGTKAGKEVIRGYLQIFSALKNANIIVEKFHISDKVYNRLHRGKEIDYSREEKKLTELGFKIVFITFKKDKKLIEKRIKDRLALYPHYKRILQTPDWYLNQQEQLKKEIKKSALPHLEIETDKLPDDEVMKEVLGWI